MWHRVLRALAYLALPLTLISASAPQQLPPFLQYKIIARYPHDRAAFTEGLLFRDGFLFESTGQEGQSDIRRVRLRDGKVLQSVKLAPNLFGEGIVDWQDQLISVTWRTGFGFRWKRESLKPFARFTYPGEGWGMTQDGTNLILSDGTTDLRFLDPANFKERRRVSVTFNGMPLNNLNELEWVDGAIFANVWQTGIIVRIDPASGKVTGRLDFSALVKQMPVRDQDSVLNGIAYDPRTKQLFVTGKNWPTLFAVQI